MTFVIERPGDRSGHALLCAMDSGQVCKGTDSSVTDFGVFVDLGGVDGIVTVPNLTWQRVDHPSQVGQEIVASVLSVDVEREQVSLSLKELQQDPFRDFARTRLGCTLSGPVTKVAPIGAFVQLEGGVLGFLPTSELVEQGGLPGVNDVLTVRVDSINVDKRQVVVSLARPTPAES
ncbi:S1 RNA-binding domain-containing protein [Streptomyces sp. NPDC058572]|uniref:S1 RNA-binding domain-containing protein n=1 Tax=Streptomyces sp. NPDC058572 TaxID=3346546 RepID=UPI003651A381